MEITQDKITDSIVHVINTCFNDGELPPLMFDLQEENNPMLMSEDGLPAPSCALYQVKGPYKGKTIIGFFIPALKFYLETQNVELEHIILHELIHALLYKKYTIAFYKRGWFPSKKDEERTGHTQEFISLLDAKWKVFQSVDSSPNS